MILSDSAIKAAVKDGSIQIEPFIEKYVNPNSVDLTLGKQLKMYRKFQPDESLSIESNPIMSRTFLDPRQKNETIDLEIPEEGLVLEPNNLYLFTTNEKIGSNIFASKVEGKSSIGRLGLFIHVTAGWIDTGFLGQITLEMVPVLPIKVYKDMKICQIAFYKVYGEVEKLYGHPELNSKYQGQVGVVESKYQDNFLANQKGHVCFTHDRLHCTICHGPKNVGLGILPTEELENENDMNNIRKQLIRKNIKEEILLDMLQFIHNVSPTVSLFAEEFTELALSLSDSELILNDLVQKRYVMKVDDKFVLDTKGEEKLYN